MRRLMRDSEGAARPAVHAVPGTAEWAGASPAARPAGCAQTTRARSQMRRARIARPLILTLAILIAVAMLPAAPVVAQPAAPPPAVALPAVALPAVAAPVAANLVAVQPAAFQSAAAQPAAAAPASGQAAAAPSGSGQPASARPAAARSAAGTHPFGAADMQGMLRVSEPQASPQGDRVAFVVGAVDFTANRTRSNLWLVNADGSGARALTSDGAGYSNPRWARDGRGVYVLSPRSGSSQIWRLTPAPPAGGGASAAPAAEAVQVTHLPVSIESFILSPDGTRAAVSIGVFSDCAVLACTAGRLELDAKSRVKAHLYPDGGGFVRHWDTWEDGTRSHLFVLTLGADGEPADVMHGMVADSPSKPFGGPEEYTFTPDGRALVFAARQGGREEPWSTNFDLYQAPIDASQAPRNLTAANPAWDTYPAFSPDGKMLAYAAATRPGFESDRLHIVLRDLATGSERKLAEAWDRSTGPLLFAADGRTLYTTADDGGQTPLFAIDVASGRVQKLAPEGHADAPALAGDRLVFCLDDLRHPAEVYSVRRDGGAPTQLTHLNQERLATLRMGEPEQFQFQGAGGDTVHGWVVKPALFTPGKRYPIALLIHGGPQTSFSNHFHYRWNAEVYAGAGYGVVMIDFHGSPGYGQAFTDSISKDWGGKPLQDLQLGLAAAVARYPWLDGDRACALGASYGGYMTNWIAGSWPDRFRCLVTHDGVFDLRMMYYSTEELWFPEWEQGGTYWQNPAGYEEFNPVRLVDKWRTPTLLIHGGLDYRVPITQGLGAFTALQRRGVPSELLVFPTENHWVLRPSDSLLWHETVLAWLARWLGPAATAAPPPSGR
jgi:dipeptidyl aminopeptidase/acylaminoacyl peptidase